MRTTGRFRFTEHVERTWFGRHKRTLMVLECEVVTPGDQHFSHYRREWIPAPASLAADYAAGLCQRIKE